LSVIRSVIRKKVRITELASTAERVSDFESDGYLVVAERRGPRARSCLGEALELLV
jgi:hypothetical protein